MVAMKITRSVLFRCCLPVMIAGPDAEETTIDERLRIEYTVIVKNKGVSIKTYR